MSHKSASNDRKSAMSTRSLEPSEVNISSIFLLYRPPSSLRGRWTRGSVEEEVGGGQTDADEASACFAHLYTMRAGTEASQCARMHGIGFCASAAPASVRARELAHRTCMHTHAQHTDTRGACVSVCTRVHACARVCTRVHACAWHNIHLKTDEKACRQMHRFKKRARERAHAHTHGGRHACVLAQTPARKRA